MKQILTLSLLALLALATAASAETLQLKVYNPGSEGIFPTTSTLIYGSSEAVLIDAQFQKQHARKLVDMVRESGKNLKYIFISHHDPDFYFGLDEVVKAFPNAKVISTAQTAYLISATKDKKLEVWKDALGADAPDKFHIPEAVESNRLTINGQAIDIRQDPNDTKRSYLWIPSLKTVLGGIPVTTGKHPWMADAWNVREIDLWISRIADMQSLKPQRVIPGHYTTNDTSPATLAFVKKYLEDYKAAVSMYKHSIGIIAEMAKKYPDLPGRDALEFGAKAFTGEESWYVASPYPPIGKTAEAAFGGTVYRLDFKDDKTMSFVETSRPNGIVDTVQYTAVEVARNVFMVYWHEPSHHISVVHVQDWNDGIVYTNIARPDGSFSNIKGTIALK